MKCPRSAGRKGCAFKLAAVKSKRKPLAHSSVTKLKLKAGKSALAPVKAKAPYAKKIGTAHAALFRITETVRGHARTAIRRLRLR